MPSPHAPRRSQFGVPSRPRKPSHRPVRKEAPPCSTSAATSTSGRNPKGIPAPAAVLMRSLGIPLPSDEGGGTGTTDAGSPATLTSSGATYDLSRSLAVELETTQGYVYTGKLVHIDEHYNVVLHEALVRRARAFDVERAARRQSAQRDAQLIASSLQGTMGGGVDEVLLNENSRHIADHMPRPRYIGTVYLRSNNIFLIRFVDTAANATASPTTAVGGAAAATPVFADHSALGRLKSSFSDMASSIKAHLQKEKMRNRAARRQRLEAKKTPTAK